MDPAENLDQWLVRTSGNEIRGPYTQEALIKQIEDGGLGPEDEVCRANHYWIYLDEREEVQAQLGIEAPRRQLPDEEEGRGDGRTSALTQEIVYRPGQNLSTESGPGTDANELPELAGELGENTDVLHNRALRQFSVRKAAAGSGITHQRSGLSPMPRPFVLGSVERPSLLRWIVSLLVACIILFVTLIWVLLMRSGH